MSSAAVESLFTETSSRLLLIESDMESKRGLQSTLSGAGFHVATLNEPEDALKSIDRNQPHLVVLDWEYPGSVIARVMNHVRREAPPMRPRLMALSQFSSEQQIVAGFELGLDDFVVRPFSAAVLVAKVKAVLRPRRPTAQVSSHLEFQQLRLDLQYLNLVIEGSVVRLRPMEFQLLKFLMLHPERVFTREQMLRRVWARDGRPRAEVDQRAVDVIVQRTRQALARHGCGGYLQTVRGFGYRLSASAG
jgi:two-component system phosphate regulon response regulator PhoB